MDYILIGSYQFDRDASKDDMRLDYCSAFQEVALDESNLSFDTVSAEVYTKTVGEQLAALPDNTPIVIYRNNSIKARFVKRGVSRIGPNTYSLTGRSPMGALTGMIHSGGIYTGQTVAEVAKEICGSIPILVKTVYAETKLYGWLPYANGKDRSARDNLVQVLFAIGAYLRTDLNGVLRIEPLWDGAASTISVDRSYSGGTVKYDSPISAVTVTEHQYIAGSDEKELFSGTSQQGDIITFSEPMHSLTATGFTILESGANYAKISSGSGSLKGKTYIHNTRLVTQTVTENAAENVKSVTDATLVSLVNSSAVAKRLADYYKCRETITNGIVSGQEKPGHVVSVYHPYDKKMVSACIVSLDTTMSGTLKSEMAALVGFLPPQPETTVIYNERNLISESGDWTVPDNVTELHYVLISGGSGGLAGEAGNTGSSSNNATASARGGSSYTTGGKGGKGGAGGLGGSGGKVVSGDITVTPGDVLHISVGLGGGAGEDGTDTTLTVGEIVYSSADGASSAIGYTDTTTGETFAATGDSGKTGGNGGDGGRFGDSSSSTSGAKGESVDENTGGDGGVSSTGSGGQYISNYRYIKNSHEFDHYVTAGETISGYTSFSRNTETGIYTLSNYKTYTTDSYDESNIPEPDTYWISGSGTTKISGKDFMHYPTVSSKAVAIMNYTQESVPSYSSPGYYYGKAGGGGGGASGKNNGNAGSSGPGGKGADGGTQPDETIYGKGGPGGNGGGGGGGAGGSGASTNAKYTESYTSYGSSGGVGGAAGIAGGGAPGCAILYYGKPKLIPSGWLKDKNGKPVLDRLGRRIIK